RDRAAAAARHLPAGRGHAAWARRQRSAAARRGQPLGPAQGQPVQLLRALRLQDPRRHRRRQLRPVRGATGRDIRVGSHHRAGARRAARGAVHNAGPQGRTAPPARARHLDGGADPPLQARNRGLQGAAGRGVQPDRVSPWRARLLRLLGRQLQARSRAHARSVVRQPPGTGAHVPGQLHRRYDRHHRDARSDPGRDRPMSAAPGPRGWDVPADLDKDPATIPDPARTPVPEELRIEIESHMALYPDPRSAALPALEAAQRVHGWCSPEAIVQVACVMRVTPASLDAVATFYDMLETRPVGAHSIFICTNISCSLRGADELYAAMRDAAGEDPAFNVRPFECLGACDIAPMASVDGVYVGPLQTEDVPRLLDDVRAGGPVLAEKQLTRRKVADPQANSRDFPAPFPEAGV